MALKWSFIYCEGTYVSWYMCRCQRTFCGSWSSFTMWVLGIKLRASVKCLYPLSHLTGFRAFCQEVCLYFVSSAKQVFFHIIVLLDILPPIYQVLDTIYKTFIVFISSHLVQINIRFLIEENLMRQREKKACGHHWGYLYAGSLELRLDACVL